MYISSEVEVENRNRIMLCIYAYAYEVEGDPIVDDFTFDLLALSINLKINTQHQQFWMNHFNVDTGMWIRNHPDLIGIKYLTDKVRGYKRASKFQ
jgi:hypothetical protein